MLNMKIYIAETKTSIEVLGGENIFYRDLDFYVQNKDLVRKTIFKQRNSSFQLQKEIVASSQRNVKYENSHSKNKGAFRSFGG